MRRGRAVAGANDQVHRRQVGLTETEPVANHALHAIAGDGVAHGLGPHGEAQPRMACRARSEVDSFIGEMSKGNGTYFAVKVPVEDKGEIDHFWLTDIVYRNGKFEGVIGNEPGIVTNVKSGQKWTVKKSEISDWMYMRDGKMFGNYTIRPLLKTMSEEEAARFRSIMANP